MNKFDMPFVIKPVLHKNFIVRVSFLLIITMVMIVSSVYLNGPFDIKLFVFLTILMLIVYYIIFRISFRTIIVNETYFTYCVLTKKIKVKYDEVDNISISTIETPNGLSYSLFLYIRTIEQYLQVSNLQIFRKREIYKLIDIIESISNQSNKDLNIQLDEIEWKFD